MPQKNRSDEDVNDFMATVLSGGESSSPSAKKQRFARKKPTESLKPTANSESRKDGQARKTSSNSVSLNETKRLKKPFRFLMALLTVVIVVVAGILLWNGPISSLLTPKSPFSEELKDLGFPLYYPTELPSGYKIELNSIKQPESDVVIYAASNEEGKKLNITLQKQPGEINLDPLYAVLSNPRDLNTKFGNIKVGSTTEGVDVANVLAGQTWVIINYPKETIDDDSLTKLINSFKF